MLLLLLALAPGRAAAQDDPFAAGVRTTPWLSPADEQKAFKLPPGFEINLVAAEPVIQKPLNMAFDERGRIWLTNTVEYPYAAPADRPGKDTIKVLEDTDGDGRYEKVTTFADGLNIPMGIYPWKGGCVAFSIPNLWHFEDADGDGVCDKRTVLYGPFDTSRDTHGMINALRRGWDGWVYACHGFNNDSRVKGTDGHEIHMQSGNVFRFQLDGSRIEHFTHGQVNPFGMCFHGLFDIFTADCHSKPIYQLLRGGYYPSFGKPHDGLGFVPPMMDHLHGSTAICGLVFGRSSNFPREYQDNFFSGNVMTSRINRNKMEMLGSTFKAVEQPDFLTTSDPWFRPVDIQIGPDGAMYIADFYNRIIGHYEVPLPHPGRDRTSGRIWRVTYTKPDDQETFAINKPGDLTKASVKELIEWIPMDDDMRPACLELCSRGKECVAELKERWKVPHNSQTDNLVLLWALEANGALDDSLIQQALDHESRWEGTHLMRIMSERKDWSDFQRAVVLSSLGDRDPFVARAAADAMGRHCKITQIWPLLARLKTTPEFDTHLRHSIRMAIRNHILALPSSVEIENLKLSASDQRELASICLGAPNSISAAILLRYLESHDDNQTAYLQHAASYADVALLPDIVRIGKFKAAADLELQAQIIQSLARGLVQRAEADTRPLADWAAEVATKLLPTDNEQRTTWIGLHADGLPLSENPWVVAARPSRDGDKESLFFYSLPKGEQRTGVYRSGVFELPEKLSFWCAGHSGYPNQAPNGGNYVRLRDAKTHAILAESRPPRNDTARRMEWDLSKWVAARGTQSVPAGVPTQSMGTRMGYLELVDGDAGNAYAWLAVGRFSLAELNPSDAPRKQQLAAEIVGQLKLSSLELRLQDLIRNPQAEAAPRTAAAQALVSLRPDARAAALATTLGDTSLPASLSQTIAQAIAERNAATLLDALRETLKHAPLRLQTTLAQTLAGDAAGADALLGLVESGHVAPRLLTLPAVSSKLAALKNGSLNQRAATITARLPPADAVLDALITDRRRAFNQSQTNQERGQAVFTKHCAACHQIAGQGATIGPQLDGIGNRGLDRLLEDTLDPNRNVDVAFRTTTLRLIDGRVLSGLVRREEGNQLVLADAQGKEFSISKSEVDEQHKTPLSLMPANAGEVVAVNEFADLLSYLLSQRGTPPGN